MEDKGRRLSLFGRLKAGLAKTREGLLAKVKGVLRRGGAISESLFEELEEALIQADVGFETTLNLMERVRARVKEERLTDAAEVHPVLEACMEEALRAAPLAPVRSDGEPLVIMAVGVNGAGKTTTVGKLAARFRAQGLKVVIGAGDTFRAAAIDQLAIWAERAGADLIAQQPGSDPAAVAYDAVHAAKARRADVLLLDTAGRLQTKSNLMQELGKVSRVVERELGRKPDETLLVLDATTGQNALSQGRLFKDTVPLTGLVLTKLDGTARGGIVLAVCQELELPVKLIGIGEGIDDLRDFDPQAFVRALLREEVEAGAPHP